MQTMFSSYYDKRLKSLNRKFIGVYIWLLGYSIVKYYKIEMYKLPNKVAGSVRYRIIRNRDRGYYEFVQKKFPQKWRNMVIILGRLLLHFYLNFL